MKAISETLTEILSAFEDTRLDYGTIHQAHKVQRQLGAKTPAAPHRFAGMSAKAKKKGTGHHSIHHLTRKLSGQIRR